MYLEQRVDNLENQVLRELRELKAILLQSQSKPKEKEIQELDLMTVARAAKYIGRSENTVRAYVKDEKLTKYDGIGRHKIMLSKEELDALKEQGTV